MAGDQTSMAEFRVAGWLGHYTLLPEVKIDDFIGVKHRC